MTAAIGFFIEVILGAVVGVTVFYGALAALELVLRGLALVSAWHIGRRRP